MTGKDPRAVRAARRRVAFHAARARKAATAGEQLKAAEAALLSAVKHAKNPPRAARSVGAADHARQVMSQAQFGDSTRALYEAKLAAPRTEQGRLGAALMCLRAAIGHIDDATERDRLYGHYAAELTREAREIEGGR